MTMLNKLNEKKLDDLFAKEKINLNVIAKNHDIDKHILLKMMCLFYDNHHDIINISESAISNNNFDLLKEKIHNIKPFMTLLGDQSLVEDIMRFENQLTNIDVSIETLKRILKRLSYWLHLSKSIGLILSLN